MLNEKELSNYIGKKIKEFRANKKWSQRQLGEKVGVSHNTISDYENGKITLGQDMLFLLADTFEVSIDDFFPARKDTSVEELITDENFDVTDIEFLRKFINKTKSLNADEKLRFMQNIRLAIEFFDKSNE